MQQIVRLPGEIIGLGGDAANELMGRSFADFNLIVFTSPLPGTLDGGKITLDATFSREEMVAAAKTDIAWRYALRELNSFVIPNISYAQHNTDGSLDLYNPATGQGAMTELYLADRAAMLTWKIRYDKGFRDDNDAVHVGGKPYFETWDTGAVKGDWDFAANDSEWRISA